MKRNIILIFLLLTTFTFTACTSKSQTDVINSGSNDISDLLKTLIQKEKEINELNQKLEDCSSKAKKQK
jgi:peptidoglycan hydrolase CwlO-like protein